MMMKRFSWAIFWVLTIPVLLSGVSCTRQDLPGSGVVTVSLSSGLPETRAITADPKDGSAIYIDNSTTPPEPDLILLIFNASGEKVTPTERKMDSLTATDIRLTFSGIQPGEYTVYALANTAGLWAMSGDPASASITRDEMEALYFTALPTVPDPSSATSRMPLTAKGTLSVNAAGSGDISLNLSRPAARVVFKFENNSGHKLKLDPFSAKFKKMAPTYGYLFQHNPDVPTSVAGFNYGDLSFIADGQEIANGTSYSQSALVYPGLPGYPDTESYLCDISFTIKEVDGNDAVLDPGYSHTFYFGDLRVHNNRGEDIKTLARNQQLTVTAKVSMGKMLSFSFEVGDWTIHSETVTFD